MIYSSAYISKCAMILMNYLVKRDSTLLKFYAHNVKEYHVTISILNPNFQNKDIQYCLILQKRFFKII